MAQRNSLWPSLVVAASVLVNVGLDLALIAGCGMGPAGAAWATVGSQYAALFLLVAVTRRGEGALRLRWMFPCLEDLKGSGNTSSSLAFIYFCKLLCYFAIQRTATGLPLVSLAAHQPVFMLWNLCSHASSPLEQVNIRPLPSTGVLQ